MTAGDEVTVGVTPFFSDPDGDELTYTAESSDAAVVAVSVSGSSLTVTAVAEGSATVTVTAADPDGLTATQSAEVTVEARTGFRDNFDSDASLDDWEIHNADAVVADGLLRLTATSQDRAALAARELRAPLTSWTLGVSMGRAEADDLVGVWWGTGHNRYNTASFNIGPLGDSNYTFWLWDNDEQDWVPVSDLSGNSEAVNDGLNELTEMTLGWEGDEFVVAAGDTELLRARLTELFEAILAEINEVLLSMEGDIGKTALFDWVSVTGTEIGAAMARAPATVSGIESARLERAAPGGSKANLARAGIGSLKAKKEH